MQYLETLEPLTLTETVFVECETRIYTDEYGVQYTVGSGCSNVKTEKPHEPGWDIVWGKVPANVN